MGRRKKTEAEHQLKGTFEKHPERREGYANVPKPEGPLGEPPASFDPETHTGEKLIAIWHELVNQAPPGVLTSSDRAHLEIACRLFHRVRTSTAKSGDYSRLESLLGKMGMNPSDRTKVNIVPTGASSPSPNVEASSPFKDLAAEEGKRAAVN